MRLKIIFNNIDWPSIPSKVEELRQWFLPKVSLEITLQKTNFYSIPFVQYTNNPTGFLGVESSWYDKNVTPLGLDQDIILFVIPESQWPFTNFARGWRTDKDHGPVELQIMGEENVFMSANGVNLGTTFFNYARHEILHALFMITGQNDTTHYWYDQHKLEMARDELVFPNKETFSLYYSIKPHKVTRPWGVYLPDVYGQFGFTHHNGEDLGIEKNSVICAPVNGMIKKIENQPTGGGLYIVLLTDGNYDWEDGKETAVELTFMHLKETKVLVGTRVKVGDVIAIPDNTGFSTGPHCHMRAKRVLKTPTGTVEVDKNDAQNTFNHARYYNGQYAFDVKLNQINEAIKKIMEQIAQYFRKG